MDIVPSKEEIEIEKAISFLVTHINKYCRNKKPLILHSLRVGLKARQLGLSHEAVVAGFLHDLVEDTCCKLQEIKKTFSPKAAKLVAALTSPKISNYKLKLRRLLAKIKKAGPEAMILKAIDCNDNLPWFKLLQEKTLLKQGYRCSL